MLFRSRVAAVVVVVVVSLVGVLAGRVVAAPSDPASPVVGSSYTVVAGDFLFGIARKVNVSFDALLKANGLRAESLILPGMRLRVPVAAPVVAKPSTPTSVTGSGVYVVARGDFLFKIASTLSVSLRSLLEANNLVLNSFIYPGMRLVVPSGGKVPSSSPVVPTPPPSSTVPQSAGSDGGVPYTVVVNDSLYKIAARFDVRVSALLTVNGLQLNSFIYPGMVLTIPVSRPSTVGESPAAGVPAKVVAVIGFARAQLGKPYRAWGSGPDSFDCSGLTLAAYGTVGVVLPHYSAAQVAFGVPVDWEVEPIRPGDLVFMEASKGAGVISHVGIATSASTWVQAPRTGDVVREGPFSTVRVVAVRRLFG